jgi:cysteinyl-tRNA synthetase, unknown class
MSVPVTHRREPESYIVRTTRWVGAIILALVLAAGLAGAALAQQQPKKGAPPAAKGAAPQPQGAARAQGQDVDLDGTVPAPIVPREAIEPREAMRAFVSEISAYARSLKRDFTVVTLGGLELLEKVDPVDPTKRAPATAYMRTIDGVIAREVSFHPPRDGRDETKTDDRIRAELVRLADFSQQRGVRVWTLDYAKDAAMAEAAVRSALAKKYVPFTSANVDYRFNRLPPGRPVNENPHNISGLNHVQNFLMLTDAAAWDTQEEFVLALAGTNYDAIVVDVYHRGRAPLSRRTVESLRYKKLGARRLVLAYMNIGEAEADRFYWKPGWREGSPYFISAPTAGNPDKYIVQYWQPGWRELITGNASSYLYGIVAQGFDGVVLDGVEAFHDQEGDR